MAQRRKLTSQITTIFAWIVTVNHTESIVTVDIDIPGAVGSRPLRLYAANRAEAMRQAPLARKFVALLNESNGTIARVDLRTFIRKEDAKPATVRPPARRPRRQFPIKP